MELKKGGVLASMGVISAPQTVPARMFNPRRIGGTAS